MPAPRPDEFSLTLPAVRGMQAGREYYVVMCPVKVLARLFPSSGEDLPPEHRAQRSLNRGRLPQLVRYIVENKTSYVFSSLAASVDRELTFAPASKDHEARHIGHLTIPVEARLLVNDGQHRLAALQVALRERAALGNENISIVIYADAGLSQSQQMFADLNRYAVKPTRSLNILFDHRDPVAALARELASAVPVFSGLTETAANTISNRERKLFTLNAIYHATQRLLEKRAKEPVTPSERKLAQEFWTQVGASMPEWMKASSGKAHPSDLRKTRVHAHGIALQALAVAGNALLTEDPRGWKRRLSKLSVIDWSRSNTSLWEGRAMSGGKICKAGNHVVLTANVVKKALGLPLTAGEARVELAHESARHQHVHRPEEDHPDAGPPERPSSNGRRALPRGREAVGHRV